MATSAELDAARKAKQEAAAAVKRDAAELAYLRKVQSLCGQLLAVPLLLVDRLVDGGHVGRVHRLPGEDLVVEDVAVLDGRVCVDVHRATSL